MNKEPNKLPGYLCPHCGELIGYLGRFFMWIFGPGLHDCKGCRHDQKPEKHLNNMKYAIHIGISSLAVALITLISQNIWVPTIFLIGMVALCFYVDVFKSISPPCLLDRILAALRDDTIEKSWSDKFRNVNFTDHLGHSYILRACDTSLHFLFEILIDGQFIIESELGLLGEIRILFQMRKCRKKVLFGKSQSLADSLGRKRETP